MLQGLVLFQCMAQIPLQYPERSADNYTRITTNSHQPWEGPVTWYEAHINSKEGWNMSGGLFLALL